MNPLTGEIVYPDSPSEIPSGFLQLTNEEAEEFQRLPNDVRLSRYIKNHRSDRCGKCNRLIGNHALKRFKQCARISVREFERAAA